MMPVLDTSNNGSTSSCNPVAAKRPLDEAIIIIDDDESPVKRQNPARSSCKMEDDDDVEIVSPPRKKGATVDLVDNNDESKIQVSWSNLTNPNVDYPHKRIHCGVHNFEEDPKAFCAKCYCVVCDDPASSCPSWDQHCRTIPKITSEIGEEVMILENQIAHVTRQHQLAISEGANILLQHMRGERRLPYAMSLPGRRGGEGNEISLEDFRRTQNQMSREEPRPSDLNITDILAKKLKLAVEESDDSDRTAHTSQSSSSKLKMEGDIGQLRLHNAFFVEGVKIGWPFSTILQPQRQIAIHIVKALKRSLHCVLESPTGTGKSAAILCSTLAWQRYHQYSSGCNDKKENPTIIYCSRTHSQVAQMVASLRKTPYRPRVCVLGSRDRMCINTDLQTRGQKRRGAGSINQLCRDRKIETDKQRKRTWKHPEKYYDDDNPTGETDENEKNQLGEETLDEDTATNTNRRQRKPTCPHYRQLSTWRTARMTQQRFVWNQSRVSCCSVGGERTSMGVHDMEDLVTFGKNPYREKNIALYREGGVGSFGITVTDRPGGKGCQIHDLPRTGLAAIDGRLQQGDWIISINGQSTKQWKSSQILEYVKSICEDPLVLDVQRQASLHEDDDDEYSIHAACPYYLSRALLPYANLVFCPYNYVLDPGIRKALSIDLNGSVVVLDEAHNVEDTLCESGSGDFSELDLCHLVCILAHYAKSHKKDRPTEVEMLRSGQTRDLSDVAHELLVFVEKLVLYMRDLRERFERSPGFQRVKQEHIRYHLSDNHAVEVAYYGPTGFGFKGEAIGCARILNELGLSHEVCSHLSELATSMQAHLFGGSSEEENHAGQTALDNSVSLLSRLELASKNPEHFYIAYEMKPNGNMEYATGMNYDEYEEMKARQPWRKDPRSTPYVTPRSEEHKDAPLQVCNHKDCGPPNPCTRHGYFCDGSKPRWECHLVLRLLFPGLLMKEITDECRSVILASGSLAPLPSLCAELNLHGTKEHCRKQTSPYLSNEKNSQSPLKSQSLQMMSFLPAEAGKISRTHLQGSSGESCQSPSVESLGRLQVVPKPLEANHVVDLQKQLFAVGIGNFPDGRPLTVSYSQYKEHSFFPRLGEAIACVVESVPRGGILIFFPSYSFLNKCIGCWNPFNPNNNAFPNQHRYPQIWARLIQSKQKVIVEPTGSQERFEEARNEYAETIKRDGSCILLAVFRGKMSEGISFNDDNARCVICVGLPFPNSFDRNVKSKKAYNEEQRKIRKKNNILPGLDWYSQQAYRAIAQALGRCIRHGADYGAIVLMDSRHCDDGSPNDGICRSHRNLPKWMRHHVRTLSMQAVGGIGNQPVEGGYLGLKQEMNSFFERAPKHSNAILEKWETDLRDAQARSKDPHTHIFDFETRKWRARSKKLEETPTMKAEL